MIDVGQVLDKYELLERVGQGGMAVVYRGLDRSLRRHVAVKVLHQHLADHDEARDRFEREAHAVAKLRHENILEIFDYSGKVGGESYIVTEFIDGKTLKQSVTEHPPKFAEIGAMVVLQICRALAHAHGQGVLHRDVKPENVMIRSDGVVKLTDFGISQMVDAQRMTVTGQLLGSPAYMSPEHVEGRPLDFRTDVFAAGIVLYQLTVGRLPFEGKNPHEILKRIAECRFADPRQANPRIGNELGRIILKAMARDPDHRYPVITAMLADLDHYLEGSGLGASKDELARYFASPSAYELALGSRLTDHLLRRARDELGTNRAGALELLDRVLTIDPAHAAANQLVAGLQRRRRWRRGVAIAAVVVLAGGGAWLTRRALRHPGRVAAAASADAADLALAALDAPAAPATDAARAPVFASDATAVALAAVDARRDDLTERRPDARAAIDAAAATGRTFVLRVVPTDAEVRIGDGPWQRFADTDGKAELPVPSSPIVVTVRKEDCCEARTESIGPDTAGTVLVRLGYKAALLTPRCPHDGVIVRVNDQAATLGAAMTIPMPGGTLNNTEVKVEFTSADKVDSQTIQLHAAEQREVTCAL